MLGTRVAWEKAYMVDGLVSRPHWQEIQDVHEDHAGNNRLQVNMCCRLGSNGTRAFLTAARTARCNIPAGAQGRKLAHLEW